MILNNIKISEISNKDELASLFSLTEKELTYILESKNVLVNKGKIYKRDGTFRTVLWIKNESYRHLLKKIRDYLNHFYSSFIPVSVHGFVKGRSIVTNAQSHTQKEIILNIDINKFFDSITYSKIVQIFILMGFQKRIAEIISELVTMDNVLATGFPTSPVLSNIVCVTMDGVFEKLAEEKDITYTRYADDITFSSQGIVLSLEQIELVLNKFEFTINPSKTRLFRKGGPQYVTGLTVVDSKPRLSKRFKRSIRLELYYVKKYGITEHLSYKPSVKVLRENIIFTRFSRVLFEGYGLRGFIAYINSIEPELSKKMCFILPPKEEESEL